MRKITLLLAAVAVAALVFIAHVPLQAKLALGFLGLVALDSLGGALFGAHRLAATGSTFSNLTTALKRRYDDKFLGAVGWSKGPLGAMIRKVAWSGSNPVFATRVGNSPARSATYATAASKSEDSTYGYTRVNQFTLDWYRDYGRATIDGLLLATAGDKLGSFYDKFVAQIDGILDATMHSFCTKVYRGGYGAIGQIDPSTTLASTTLVLKTPEDVVLFEKGMDIQLAQFENSGALRSAGAVATITGVNLSNTGGNLVGTLTTSVNINTAIAAAALNDYIFASGDRNNAASPVRTALGGLAAWGSIVNGAFTAPTGGENFYGNDRSTDSRLVFNYFDARGMSEEEAIIKAAVEAIRFGGRPKALFLNPTKYGNLLVQGQARFRPITVKGPYGVGFDGVGVQTQMGEVQVYPDLYCQRQFGWMLEMDSLQVYGAGTSKIPDFITADGNKILRQSADDGIECRVGYYGSQGCDAPIHNTTIQFE
jgi:hypothetical protein